MTYNTSLILYFFRFLASRASLEEPQQDYYGSTDVTEAAELVWFVTEASALSIAPPAPRAVVRITRGMKIFIGNKELSLRPMSKAILLLFLLHPEGIELKRIGDYADELARHYARVTRADDPDAVRARVDKVVDVFSNELNVNLSRVNAAISALEKDGDYLVRGPRGQLKGIGLDRTLVIWE